MSINASVQQISGGIASFAAGLIVIQQDNGFLDRYNNLGHVVMVTILITIAMMYYIDLRVKEKIQAEKSSIKLPEAA